MDDPVADRSEITTCETCTGRFVGDSCAFCEWWARAETLIDLLRVELGRGLGTSITDVLACRRFRLGDDDADR
jgi:hypothetical protein